MAGVRRNAPAVLVLAAVASSIGCQRGPSHAERDVYARPAAPPSESGVADEAAGEAAPEVPVLRRATPNVDGSAGSRELPPRERPVEILLPRPALWVEASMGVSNRAGFHRPTVSYDDVPRCGSIWFDETLRTDWYEGPVVREEEASLASAFGQDGAYHDSPIGMSVTCDVAHGGLLCRGDACNSMANSLPLRCHSRPVPGRRSEVQRTRGFEPTRHWRRAGPGSVSISYACLRSEGRVRCHPMQYPRERRMRRPPPVDAPALDAWTDVRDLAGAGSHACVVLGDGSVHCWGIPYLPDFAADDSNEEQLRAAMLEYSDQPWMPRRIEGLPPVVQISVGLRTTCARTEDGRVFCWGAPACLETPSFLAPVLPGSDGHAASPWQGPPSVVAHERAGAGPCRHGRIRTEDGRGCCWTGQAWDASTERCVGAPACPPEATATGSTCTVRCPPGAVPVVGGTLAMGSDDGAEDERPVHRTTVTSFCLDTTEVTVRAYRRCVEDRACRVPQDDDSEHTFRPGPTRFDRHPINGVSWDDARRYCAWRGSRLPTEAEWEYAARGPDGASYPWGEEPPERSWPQWSVAGCGGRRCAPYPTGGIGGPLRGDSPFGAQGMGSGVWEWVADWYGSYPDEALRDPTGPRSGTHRVLRGGGNDVGHPDGFRSTNRSRGRPDDRSLYVGFRCAQPAVP